jgi:hypothetical protein
MPFNVRVWRAGRNAPFSVPVPQAAIEAVELQALIEASTSGKDIGFSAASWSMFLASAAGVREGEHPLPFNHPFAPAPGSIENVWVERVVAPAAGEPWGPW